MCIDVPFVLLHERFAEMQDHLNQAKRDVGDQSARFRNPKIWVLEASAARTI
jgi:ribosomal protein S15P/S13E